MRSTLLVTAALAMGAIAGPLRRRQDGVYTEVDWVDVTVTEYVTATGPYVPAETPSSVAIAAVSSAANGGHGHHHSHSYAKPSSSAAYSAPASSAAPSSAPAYSAPASSVVESSVAPSSSAPAYTPAPPSSAAKTSSAAAPTSSSSYGGAAGPDHITGDAENDYTSGTDYQNIVLFHHNVHRVNHSAPQLTWNDSLAASAQSWASKCQFQHNSAGQNLAASAPNANVSAQITDSWYNNEIENYNAYYGQDTPSGNLELYGHATQVVWKGTETVGCATFDCRSESLGMWYTVCNYYPFGNVSPLWADNLVKGEGAAVAGWTD